ncbi:MAG: PIN domain-containing protein [Candidatus Aenigmarchaeota archaeon]|nr:PIN domain-containing protein [Candidatus Aenigmarchaeota archaeon]
MKIVVDTNRIIAALVKDSTTREILFDRNFEFVTPDHTIKEVYEHKDELKVKTNLSNEEFDILMAFIFERIEIIPESDYRDFMEECRNDISDPDDVPILAAAVAIKTDGIWAHDPHFREQNKIKVFTNIDMLRFSGRMKSG